MPYVKQIQREYLDASLLPRPRDVGELNYVITKLAHDCIGRWGDNYQAMNDVLGAFEAAKLELYRRKIAPYEDIKIKMNGDVE